MTDTKHDKIAKRLAQKENVEYNKGKGPDIITSRRVIEVAINDTDLNESKKQLQGFRKPRYLATTTENIKKAMSVTEGLKIGVMGPTGHIHKKAGSRSRKK
ncbi:hypothetical protein KKB99_02750 [bacterium]|nr:hypothetical protein [bacterium]MBU1024907.1 hypothetical protein [bacterium]